MYCLVPEKPLRLVYGTFYLAIGDTFYDFINLDNLFKIKDLFYEYAHLLVDKIGYFKV